MVNKTAAWQIALREAIHDPRELWELLELDKNLLAGATAAAKLFPLQVPRGFVARMQKGNPRDPLLQQVLPQGAELVMVPGYQNDPLAENRSNPVPGLLHKYHNRVLLTIMGTCAVNCRFCFRRHFPYEANNPGIEGWERAFDYIAQNASINEVILSGGDPLMVSDKILHHFTEKLDLISHVKHLRIHSRLPIVLPERITPEFIGWINQLKQKPILVTHCNHPQEINDTVRVALQLLKQAGVVLLNHTVLLKGINDDADTLVALSEALFEAEVLPYYLNLLDKVQGAAHFDIELSRARKLHWEISQRLSGYLVPKLAYEQPGAPAKVSLGLYTE